MRHEGNISKIDHYECKTLRSVGANMQVHRCSANHSRIPLSRIAPCACGGREAMSKEKRNNVREPQAFAQKPGARQWKDLGLQRETVILVAGEVEARASGLEDTNGPGNQVAVHHDGEPAVGQNQKASADMNTSVRVHALQQIDGVK